MLGVTLQSENVEHEHFRVWGTHPLRKVEDDVLKLYMMVKISVCKLLTLYFCFWEFFVSSGCVILLSV